MEATLLAKLISHNTSTLDSELLSCIQQYYFDNVLKSIGEEKERSSPKWSMLVTCQKMFFAYSSNSVYGTRKKEDVRGFIVFNREEIKRH